MGNFVLSNGYQDCELDSEFCFICKEDFKNVKLFQTKFSFSLEKFKIKITVSNQVDGIKGVFGLLRFPLIFLFMKSKGANFA